MNKVQRVGVNVKACHALRTGDNSVYLLFDGNTLQLLSGERFASIRDISPDEIPEIANLLRTMADYMEEKRPYP